MPPRSGAPAVRTYDAISKGIADSIEHAVLRLDPRPGERILDLATGTGWTSRLVARRGATVIGADIATDLLAAARANATAAGLSIDYQVGDAERLPFKDGEFDAVISTCGVMFASRPEKAAREMARVERRDAEAEPLMLAADRVLKPVPGRQARERDANRDRLAALYTGQGRLQQAAAYR